MGEGSQGIHGYGVPASLPVAKFLTVIFPPKKEGGVPVDDKYATICIDDDLFPPEEGFVSFVPAEKVDDEVSRVMELWPGRVAAHGVRHRPLDSPKKAALLFYEKTGSIPMAYAQPYGMLNRFLQKEAEHIFTFVRLPGRTFNERWSRFPIDLPFHLLKSVLDLESGWVVLVTHNLLEARRSRTLLREKGFKIVDFVDVIDMI